MSKIRKFASKKISSKVTFEEFIEVLTEQLAKKGIAFRPTVHSKGTQTKEIRSLQGQVGKVDITFQTGFLGLSLIRETLGGLAVKVDGEGNVADFEFRLDAYTPLVQQRSRTFVRQLQRALEQRLVEIPLVGNDLVDEDDVAQIGDHFGGRVVYLRSREQKAYAERVSARVRSSKPIIPPKAVLVVPEWRTGLSSSSRSIYVARNKAGALTLLVPKILVDEQPKAIKNLRMAALATAVVQDRAKAAVEGSNLNVDVSVDADGDIQGVDVQWERPKQQDLHEEQVVPQVEVVQDRRVSTGQRMLDWASQVAQRAIMKNAIVFTKKG